MWFFRRGSISDKDEVLASFAALVEKQRRFIGTQYVVLEHQRLQIQQHLQLISALEELLRLSLQHDPHPLVTSRKTH